jgi:sugar lactone lactonase YvrE
MSLETLAFGYGLIEGPRVDAADCLYFSDVRGGGVYRRSPDGTIETVVPKRRGVGGIALHVDGGIVVSGRTIAHVRDGQTRLLYAPEDVPGFNDLFTDERGRVYVGSIRSDPFGAGPRVPGELWRIDRAGEATLLYDQVGLSNGLGFAPDGRRLYHADSAARAIIVHDVAEDGTLHDRRSFPMLVEGVPDGLAVDEAGCLWVAAARGGCAARYRPDGTLERTLPVPARMVTSLCFGGEDRRDLYLVSADNTDDPARKGTIFRTRVDVPGLPVPPARV